MNLQVKHYGRVRGGEMVFSLPDLLRQNLIELEGKEFVMTIKKKHEKVSSNQYGYYRGAILIACHKSDVFIHMDSKDAIHDEYFAPEFLSYKKLVELPNKRYEVTLVRSLADLSKEEMSEFIERVLVRCDELGITVLPPEMFYNKYYEHK